MSMIRKRTSSNKCGGFTLLELLTVVAIISILVMISVPIYRNVQKDAEKKVLEYNAKVISTVLYQYLEELREDGELDRTTVRRLTATAIGDSEHPLYGRIDGSNLDETWITYVNMNYTSEEYGGFGLEWKGYQVEYHVGEDIEVTSLAE